MSDSDPDLFGRESQMAAAPSESDEETEAEPSIMLVPLDDNFELPDSFQLMRSQNASRRCSGDSDALASEDSEISEEAGQVFVMMEGTFRVSRNTRAQWFLQFLNKTIVWNPETEDRPEDKEPLEIISCIPRRPAFPVEAEPPSTGRTFRITPHTAVTFLSKSYRLVFALDLTPSMASVSLTNGCVAFDELYRALQECLTAISQPTVIPGTAKPFAPKVFVTVLAHAPFLGSKSTPVIVKGFKLLPETLPDLLKIIHDELVHLENDVVPRLNEELRRCSTPANGEAKKAKPYMTMDLTLANILRKGLLSVQLLPDNSCGHIVVVTDGIVDFPDVTVMDNLLSQLRTHTISVSFIRVAYPGPGRLFGSDFGCLCNTDLMEFIARTTTGAYVEYQPSLVREKPFVGARVLGELDGSDASVFQTAFFTWTFQRGIETLQSDQARRPNSLMFDSVGAAGMIRQFLNKMIIDVSLGGLLSTRLREGFTIKSVGFSKGDTCIEIVLTMPWKPEISLEYRIDAVWPPVDGTTVTAEIWVEAPYEFLHDLSFPAQKNTFGPFRQATLRRFKFMIQSLEQTDQFLLHVEKFRTNPAHYSIPDLMREKMPVFYLPPGDIDNPTLSSADLVDFPEFTSFWRQLCTMDVNLWHKWLHVHRISILLEHDKPLCTNIFGIRRSANSSVRCSLASKLLHDLLKNWCSIVLVDSHSYIRFIGDDVEDGEAPLSFFIIRMAAKPPCVVLRLAFLGGTSGNIRHKIISELEEKLSELTMGVKENLNAELTAVLCCWRFAKPVEKMLIQYKDVPSEMFNTYTSISSAVNAAQPAFPVANPGAFQALSRFLYSRRHVWQPLPTNSPLLFFDVIGRVLTVLARMRLREGFRFASTSGGVYNLTKEIEMADPSGIASRSEGETDEAIDFPPCVAQYIIFPPCDVTASTRDQDDAGDVKEQKYSLAVEVWLEPQYGLALSDSDATKYMQGLKYQQIPDKIHEVDQDLLSTFLTFETLVAICGLPPSSTRKPWSCPQPEKPPFSRQSSSSQIKPGAKLSEDGAEILPFPFSIPCLLSKCNKSRMLFCSMRRSQVAPNVTATNELLFQFFTSEVRRLHSREISLTKADSAAILQLLRDGSPIVGDLESADSNQDNDVVDSGDNSGPEPEIIPVRSDWKCFVKLIRETETLIITVMPASYGVLRKLDESLDLDEIEGPALNFSKSDGSTYGDSSAVSHGEGDSESEETFLPQRPSALPIPVFLFSCSFGSLQSIVVERRTLNPLLDFDYDLTQQFGIQYERPLVKRCSESRNDGEWISERGLARTMSLPIRASKECSKLWILCASIEDAFSKGFVQAVYRSLHKGFSVDPYDIQQATDNCVEVPVEVDLTTFLRSVCPHFKKLSRKRRTSGNSPKSTEVVLQNFPPPQNHLLIKNQFLAIVTTCLKKIPTKADIWYFVPPGFQGEDNSSPDSEGKLSDSSDRTVVFRIDGGEGSCLRESVSGLSDTNESGHGFFAKDPDALSVCSDASITSVFGSYPSEIAPAGDAEEEEDDDYQNPLFVAFVCTAISTAATPAKILGNVNVQQLPTCLGEVFSGMDVSKRLLDFSSLEVKLDILCLSLPDELKQIQVAEGRISRRTISGGSAISNVHGSDSDMSTVHDENASTEAEDFGQLPPEQSEVMKTMVDNLKWHLRDEVAYTLSNSDTMPTEEHLNLVVDHVRESKTRKTCVMQDLPLRFVFNIELSFKMFLERFEKTTIQGFHFAKEGQFYFLTLGRSSPLIGRRSFTRQTSAASDQEDRRRPRSPSLDLDKHTKQYASTRRSLVGLSPRRSSLPLYPVYKHSHGMVNPVDNADIKAFNRLPPLRDSSISADDDTFVFDESGSWKGESLADRGYDAGSSESEEEVEFAAVPSKSAILPGFWLILRLTSSEANIYFHVRESDMDGPVMAKQIVLIDETQKRLRAIAKVVNQQLLLEDMLTTRNCNNLVEPETTDEVWAGSRLPDMVRASSGNVDEDITVDTNYLEASRHFSPGFFKCDQVFEKEFAVHARLKLTAQRGVSQGMRAMMGLLNKFAVSNRQNMFVLQETQKDHKGPIFYIRMHEKTFPRRMISQTEEALSSRVNSVGKELDQQSSASNENTPRSVSFEESFSSDSFHGVAKPTDAIILTFYGICPVTEEISQELILALQNRLDEAVLEVLSVSLTRNAMTKLHVEDVRFIQPLRGEPAEVLEVMLPDEIGMNWKDQFCVFHYLLQNLGTFLIAPKYSDSDLEKHFRYVDLATHEWKVADDEASFLFNRPQDSGGKGIGFIYVILAKNKPILPEKSESPEFSPNLPAQLDALTAVRSVKSNGDIRFVVWEKSNIDRAALLDRLRSAVHHALLDFWLEKQIVPDLKSQSETSLPVSRCGVLESYLKTCDDAKSAGCGSDTFALPSRRSLDGIVENIVGLMQSSNANLNVFSSARCLDLKGDCLAKADILVESGKALKLLLTPQLQNLVPGHVVHVTLLGLSLEDCPEKRMRSISVDTCPGEDRSKQKSQKRFMSRVDHMGTVTVPRSRLLYLTIRDTECQLFLYNFSAELSVYLESSLHRLMEWQHERTRLLNNILLQKCGVFQPMGEFASEAGKAERHLRDFPAFSANPLQVDVLVASGSFPSPSSSKNISNPKYNVALMPAFDIVMENSFPSRFFADEMTAGIDDPVLYHGKQFQELRLRKRRMNEVRHRLNNLYSLWQQRQFRTPVSEDLLTLLKNNSRPAHFCASPLLFDPQWRKNLGDRFPDRQLLCSSPVQRGYLRDDESLPGTRSRHNSGVPTPLKEKPKPVVVSSEPSRKPSGADTQWHTQIRDNVMREYTYYLTMQGFTVVLAKPPSPPRHVRRSPQSNTRSASGTSTPSIPADGPPAVAPVPRFMPNYTYLQRCVPGGMILLELFFMEPFFFSRMFAVDRVKYSDDFSMVGNDPDKALLNLQKEVDRLKVAMHMHSFLYDFHLRCMSDFMSGKHLFIKPGYHVVSFFDDFGNYYQKAPSFAKSCFQTGSLCVASGKSIPPTQLYNFIMKHDKQYGLNAVCMMPVSSDDNLGERESSYALACTDLPGSTHEGFQCTYIVYADTNDALIYPAAHGASSLQLRYYVILTSKTDVYSTDYIEERFGSFKTLPPPKRPRTSVTDSRRPSGVSEVPKMSSVSAALERALTSGIHPGVQQVQNTTVPHSSSENLDAKASLVAAFPNFLYIGYFSRLETELSRIIETQRSVLEEFIRKVVEKATSDCIRDTLWQRLASVRLGSEDATAHRIRDGMVREGSGVMSGRGFSDGGSHFARLTNSEFEDLVSHVYRLPVVSWDDQLSMFFHGNSAWCEGLLESLKTKYWDTKRHFVTDHNTAREIQHLVIVSASLPDIALYLTLKTTRPTSLETCLLSRYPISVPDLKKSSQFAHFMEGFVNACCFHMWKNVLPL